MRWRDVKKATHNIDSTKECDASDHNLAGLFDRFKAQVVDIFMIYMPILYFVTYVVIGDAESFRNSTWAPILCVMIYGIIVSVFMHFSAQSPGKRAYNLIVIRDDSKKVTLLFSIARFFLFLISGCIVVGLLTSFFRKDKKMLYDIILHSNVYKKC